MNHQYFKLIFVSLFCINFSALSDSIELFNDSKNDIFVTSVDTCAYQCIDNTTGANELCCMSKSQGRTLTGISYHGWLIRGKKTTGDQSNSESEDFKQSNYTFKVYLVADPVNFDHLRKFGKVIDQSKKQLMFSKSNVKPGQTLRFPSDFVTDEVAILELTPPCNLANITYDEIYPNILTFQTIVNKTGVAYEYNNLDKGLNLKIPANSTVYPTFNNNEIPAGRYLDVREYGVWGNAEQLMFKNLADKPCPTATPNCTYSITFNAYSGEIPLSLKFVVAPANKQVSMILQNVNPGGDSATETTTDLNLSQLKTTITTATDRLYTALKNSISASRFAGQNVKTAIGVPFIWLSITIDITGITVDKLWVVLRSPDAFCQLVDGTGSADRRIITGDELAKMITQSTRTYDVKKSNGATPK